MSDQPAVAEHQVQLLQKQLQQQEQQAQAAAAQVPKTADPVYVTGQSVLTGYRKI